MEDVTPPTIPNTQTSPRFDSINNTSLYLKKFKIIHLLPISFALFFPVTIISKSEPTRELEEKKGKLILGCWNVGLKRYYLVSFCCPHGEFPQSYHFSWQRVFKANTGGALKSPLSSKVIAHTLWASRDGERRDWEGGSILIHLEAYCKNHLFLCFSVSLFWEIFLQISQGFQLRWLDGLF